MHADYLFINEPTDWQAIEDVAELLPHLDVVPALALVVKSIDACHGSALVVSPELKKVLRVLDRLRKHQRDGLETLLTTVHIVT